MINKVRLGEWSRDRRVLLALIAFFLIIFFFITFVFGIIAENNSDRLILSFPHAREEGKMVSRERIVANESSKEMKVNELVKQLGLGPNEELRDKCFGIFPLGLKAKSVLVINDKVNIQLPTDFILYESEHRYTVDRSVEVLKYNLEQNFNWLQGLVVTVNGIELFNSDQDLKTGMIPSEEDHLEPEEELE